jgi:hypothetical protein
MLSVVVPVVSPVAVAVSMLLGLDVLALLVAARRRAVRRSMAERARRRERDRLRVVVERRRASASAGTATAEQLVPPVADREEPPETTVEADVPVTAEAPADRVARELSEGGTPWVPVPVPPPTYTMKPAAPRSEPAPLDLPPISCPTSPAAPAASSEPGAVPEVSVPSPVSGASVPSPVSGASVPSPVPGASSASEPAVRAPRPWDADRTFADELDLDAVLARRRAVNG